MPKSDYNQDRKLLFETQSRHEAALNILFGKANDTAVELAVLKVKAAIWGGVAGIVLGAAATLVGELILRKG